MFLVYWLWLVWDLVVATGWFGGCAYCGFGFGFMGFIVVVGVSGVPVYDSGVCVSLDCRR